MQRGMAPRSGFVQPFAQPGPAQRACIWPAISFWAKYRPAVPGRLAQALNLHFERQLWRAVNVGTQSDADRLKQRLISLSTRLDDRLGQALTSGSARRAQRLPINGDRPTGRAWQVADFRQKSIIRAMSLPSAGSWGPVKLCMSYGPACYGCRDARSPLPFLPGRMPSGWL
jgi:hypothetical protein